MLPCIIEDIFCNFLGLAFELSSTLESLLPTMMLIATIAPITGSIGIVITTTLLCGDVRLDILLIIPHCYFMMYVIERKRMKVSSVIGYQFS